MMFPCTEGMIDGETTWWYRVGKSDDFPCIFIRLAGHRNIRISRTIIYRRTLIVLQNIPSLSCQAQVAVTAWIERASDELPRAVVRNDRAAIGSAPYTIVHNAQEGSGHLGRCEFDVMLVVVYWMGLVVWTLLW